MSLIAATDLVTGSEWNGMCRPWVRKIKAAIGLGVSQSQREARVKLENVGVAEYPRLNCESQVIMNKREFN